MTKWRNLFARGPQTAPACRPAPENALSTEPIECGDLTINTAKRTATLHSHELELTSKEFDALLFLATHPRGLVTQRTNLTTTWSAGKLRQTEFLRNLASLRNKLNAVGTDKPYLRAEVLVMYRFDPNSSVRPEGETQSGTN